MPRTSGAVPGWWAAAFLAAFASGGAPPASGQTEGPEGPAAALARGLDAEQSRAFGAAVQAYRAAVAPSTVAQAVLGLERVYTEIGRPDSLLPLLDSLIAAHPPVALYRTVQLRVLLSAERPGDARRAFDRWVRDLPADGEPYRAYAQLLLQQGQTLAADSVLRVGRAAVHGGRGFAYELAQLRASTGHWIASARAWREALDSAAYLEQAAVFALAPTPEMQRDSVRLILRAPPLVVAPRRALAGLEMAWGRAAAAWGALRVLPADSAAAAAWVDFAARAEAAGAWLAARDALAAATRGHPSASIAARAAADAMQGGDAEGALSLLGRAAGADSASALSLVPLHVRALAALGRTADAEMVAAGAAGKLSPEQVAELAGVVASSWVRRGDLARARAALARVGTDSVGDVAGWLALYDGRLGTARRLLAHAQTSEPARVVALALLARTTADSVPAAGSAFLALAQGDTARAARAFEVAAASLGDAASVVLLLAAQLHAARGEDTLAIGAWHVILDRYPESPEAAEADLSWARALRRRGDSLGATQRLEHLILTYPESALVPQARRDLEQIKGDAS